MLIRLPSFYRQIQIEQGVRMAYEFAGHFSPTSSKFAGSVLSIMPLC
ncbi:MAG: hypothetical protein CNCCGFBP_02044 [Fimbriimonadaceae bacterium]|nr:hypothetical protein [Fimbriimonadaceae bacterium]